MGMKMGRLLTAISILLLVFAGCGDKDSEDVFANMSGTGNQAGDPATGDPTDPATGDPADPGVSVDTADYLAQPPIAFTATPEVRGIYVTSNHAGTQRLLDGHIALTQAYGMNAMVIDVRTEKEVTIKRWLDFADEWGVSVNFIPDVSALLRRLEAEGIYPIARIVTFKDEYTVHHRPELYIHNQDGSIWLDSANQSKAAPWLNPYNRDAWDYVLTYAVAAAELGFKEIQFDYVRFAATSRLSTADFGDIGDMTRMDAIEAFLTYAVEQLRPYGVKVSADVYGTIINSDIDAAIVGQDYTALARIVDVICPMVYPSHFADGTYQLDCPDLEPYETIYRSMLKSAERLSVIGEDEHCAIVRPWLQSFTASYLPRYLPYTGVERAAQIQAVYDAGLTEWLFWDANNRYGSDEVFIE